MIYCCITITVLQYIVSLLFPPCNIYICNGNSLFLETVFLEVLLDPFHLIPFLNVEKPFFYLDIQKPGSVVFLLVCIFRKQIKCPLGNMKFRKLEYEWFVKKGRKLKKTFIMLKLWKKETNEKVLQLYTGMKPGHIRILQGICYSTAP